MLTLSDVDVGAMLRRCWFRNAVRTKIISSANMFSITKTVATIHALVALSAALQHHAHSSTLVTPPFIRLMNSFRHVLLVAPGLGVYRDCTGCANCGARSISIGEHIKRMLRNYPELMLAKSQ
jgi:hypothetical protein